MRLPALSVALSSTQWVGGEQVAVDGGRGGNSGRNSGLTVRWVVLLQAANRAMGRASSRMRLMSYS